MTAAACDNSRASTSFDYWRRGVRFLTGVSSEGVWTLKNLTRSVALCWMALIEEAVGQIGRKSNSRRIRFSETVKSLMTPVAHSPVPPERG